MCHETFVTCIVLKHPIYLIAAISWLSPCSAFGNTISRHWLGLAISDGMNCEFKEVCGKSTGECLKSSYRLREDERSIHKAARVYF